MADQKISEMPVDVALDGSELVPVVQNGNKRTTTGAIAALAPGTDLSYNPATRTIASSTGDDVQLPLVSPTAAGLVPDAWLTGAEPAALPHIHGALAGAVYEHVRNHSGAPMPALSPYHVVDSQGDTDRVLIVPADPGVPGSMPASGVTLTALDANGAGADGHGAVAGVAVAVPTGAWPSGTVLYVAVGGGLTDQPPANGAQMVGVVGRSHANTGTLALLLAPSLARVAYSGSYAHLDGLPPLGTAAAQDAGAFATAAQGAKADSAVQPSTLTTALATKADLVNGVVPSAQLPGYVDDVLEFASLAAFPTTGEAGKLYVSLATNRQYRWSGSQYTEISPSPGSTDSVPEGSVNLYFTTGRAQQTIVDALSNTAPQNPAATAAAGTSGAVSRADHAHRYQPTDMVVPLSGETMAVPNTTLPLVTIARWPTAQTLLGLPLWSLNSAPTGANMILDMRINGVSVFATLPSIDATEQGSETAATPGVFSAAFIASNYLIPQYSVVTFWATQVGTGGGVGLKVSLPLRRAT